MLFTLPVSIGEGIDKLTILDIKLTFIKDESKRKEVKKEYDTLVESLETYIKKCDRHYKLLKKINLDIWNLEDEIRSEISTERCAQVAKSIVYENDSRFRVKDKINKMCSSELKEQKGYLVKTVGKVYVSENDFDKYIDIILESSVRNDKVEVRFIPNVERQKIIEYFKYDDMITFTPKFKDGFLLSHIGLGDSILCIGMMNFLSNLYEKLTVICKEKYMDNLKLLISNPKIEFYPVKEDKDISPVYGYEMNKFTKLAENQDIYICGNHNFFKKNNHKTLNFPLELYDDIGVPRKVFWDFHSINKPQESIELYNLLKKNNINEYIVVHNISSTGKVFETKDVISKYAETDLFIINFIENEYEPSHKYYELAQQFVYKPIAYYQDVISNAKYIFFADSSIFSLSLHLPIKTDFCYFIPRCSYPYEQIYDESIFDKTKYKKFKRLQI
jgi:hypothetical protein